MVAQCRHSLSPKTYNGCKPTLITSIMYFIQLCVRSHSTAFVIPISSTMKYSSQPTPSTLERDFGPEWSDRLRMNIVSNSELMIVEQEAWKDQAHMRDDNLADPRPVDPWRLITPPGTPRKEYDDQREDVDDGLRFEQEYEPTQWALVKFDYNFEAFKRVKAHQSRCSLETQSFAKKIVWYIFLAVLLHGIWTHLNESEKRGMCDCHCSYCSATVD